MNELKLTVYGNPFGKERPRASKHVVYTPAKTKAYEALVRNLYYEKYGEQEMFHQGVPLEANVIAYYPIPKSTSKKQHALMVSNQLFPMKKPDLDNVEKVCMDALNKYAYHDDSQVCRVVSEKYYSDEPRVEITIKVLER